MNNFLSPAGTANPTRRVENKKKALGMDAKPIFTGSASSYLPQSMTIIAVRPPISKQIPWSELSKLRPYY